MNTKVPIKQMKWRKKDCEINNWVLTRRACMHAHPYKAVTIIVISPSGSLSFSPFYNSLSCRKTAKAPHFSLSPSELLSRCPLLQYRERHVNVKRALLCEFTSALHIKIALSLSISHPLKSLFHLIWIWISQHGHIEHDTLNEK